MKRVTIAPRTDWEKKVEAIGLIYHHTEGRPYWNESAYYSFRASEIDRIELATNELQEMCLQAAQTSSTSNRFQRIVDSRRRDSDHKASLGRRAASALWAASIFAYDGDQLKLLEYNADTPTALLEAAVSQWYWLQELYPQRDQFNSIHEKAACQVERAQTLRRQPAPLRLSRTAGRREQRRLMTVSYLMDVAGQAGIESVLLRIDDIGWDAQQNCFVDLDGRPMRSIFKLYPWEWLLRDQYANQLLSAYTLTQWIEPIWKMLLSNKGILPILWELFPGHPNLLECYFNESKKLMTM
jgi:glutathionylspermidine synthase